MTTIADAIAPHAVPRTDLLRRYPGPAGLVSRILGVVPHAWGLLEVWPPALTTYNLTVPALFDVPKCDVGKGISPDLRGLVAHASSRSFGCMYCTAHTAIMGTVFGGPADAPRVVARVEGTTAPSDLTIAEHVAISYAGAAGAVPHEVTASHLRDLRVHYEPDHIEGIVMVAVAMGFLNRAMDTLGTPLETAVHFAAGETLLTRTAWDPTKHQQGDDAQDADERLSMASRLKLIREVPGAIAYERRALSDVPTDRDAQRDLLVDRMGFAPNWLEVVDRTPSRRLLVHWIVERLLAEGPLHTLGVATKAAAGWVHARAAGNPLLAAHMAFIALNNGVTPEDLHAIADGRVPKSSMISPQAMALADSTSGGASAVDSLVIDDLLAAHGPDGVVEMVLSLSIIAGLHRLTISLADGRLEPAVADALRATDLQLVP